MRFESRLGALLLGAVMLAGCTTLSEGEFNNAQAVLSGSPAIKAKVIKECISDQAKLPLAERKTVAEVVNVSLERQPATTCNRLWNAVARGRITYADYRNLSSSSADSSKVIKILQGR
ncbi:hypothetical protein [Mesorhizobium sophorae]|uniref:hypothetical protein n=1 Tax=Mesorhizobium sophorae TaxID=1300294 RepID=UPI000BA48A82|nr:hypothetical protein [Mesorhizobium sophorae]